MNRKPEPKAAAQLLTQAFAAQGVTLKHQAALNLLATLEGFESYAHLKAAQLPEVPQAPAAPAEHVVHLLFSEEYVDKLNAARRDDDEAGVNEMLDEAKTFRFESEVELQAFLDGVYEGCGWMEFTNVTEDIADMHN